MTLSFGILPAAIGSMQIFGHSLAELQSRVDVPVGPPECQFGRIERLIDQNVQLGELFLAWRGSGFRRTIARSSSTEYTNDPVLSYGSHG